MVTPSSSPVAASSAISATSAVSTKNFMAGPVMLGWPARPAMAAGRVGGATRSCDRNGRPRPPPQARPRPKKQRKTAPAVKSNKGEASAMEQDDAILVGKGETAQLLHLGLANRHGLIAGATGTGKTVSLQILAEGFSSRGVPVFMADVKGDLSGISQPAALNPKLRERAADGRHRRLCRARLPGRVLGPVRRAGPPDPHHGLGDGAAPARPPARPQRHPGRACSTSPSGSPTTRVCCCSTSRICAR